MFDYNIVNITCISNEGYGNKLKVGGNYKGVSNKKVVRLKGENDIEATYLISRFVVLDFVDAEDNTVISDGVIIVKNWDRYQFKEVLKEVRKIMEALCERSTIENEQ